jgi:O-methyltransferase
MASGWRQFSRQSREMRLKYLMSRLAFQASMMMSSQTTRVEGAEAVMTDPKTLYLELMQRCLTRGIYRDPKLVPVKRDRLVKRLCAKAFASVGVQLVKATRANRYDFDARQAGHDEPFPTWYPHTMVGLGSLDNIQFCMEDVLKQRVPGDFIETGVWQGGAAIFMRAVLKAHDVSDRTVWAADSFQGFPRGNPEKYSDDVGAEGLLAVSIDQVKANFASYGLLDEHVKFLKGWFSETLPTAPIKCLAVARLDGDQYGSTMDALTNLYPKLSVGGYLILDDYGAAVACHDAVHDFRKTHNIEEEIRRVDHTCVYWQRTR